MLTEKFDTTYECIVQGLFEMAAEACNPDKGRAYLTAGKILLAAFDDKISHNSKCVITKLWEECINNVYRYSQDN